MLLAQRTQTFFRASLLGKISGLQNSCFCISSTGWCTMSKSFFENCITIGRSVQFCLVSNCLVRNHLDPRNFLYKYDGGVKYLLPWDGSRPWSCLQARSSPGYGSSSGFGSSCHHLLHSPCWSWSC